MFMLFLSIIVIHLDSKGSFFSNLSIASPIQLSIHSRRNCLDHSHYSDRVVNSANEAQHLL